MGRYRRTSSPPLAALALLILLLFHCGAAARPLLVHHENGGKDAADDLVLPEGNTAGNGDELSTSEMMMGAEEVELACEDGEDECMQRRMLLGDAHLDYIYTQHKGKP